MTATAETGTRVELKNLVAGRWQDGHGKAIASTNPSRPGSVVGVGALAGRTQVDEAVAAAARALPAWARTPHHERAAVLTRAAAVLEQSAEAWGHELAAEEGKTAAEGSGRSFGRRRSCGTARGRPTVRRGRFSRRRGGANGCWSPAG